MPKLLHDRPFPLQLTWFVDFAFPGALATPLLQHEDEDPLGEGTSSSPARVVVGSAATKQRRRQTLSGRASSPISLGATRFSQCGRNSTGRLCAHAAHARLIELVTGYGEMPMRLGGLATIGVRRPPNLSTAVFDNSDYGESSMQARRTEAGIELVVVARACGIKETFDISDELRLPEFVARVRKLATSLFARVSFRADKPPLACRRATASISKRDFAKPWAPKLDRDAHAGCKLAGRFTPIEGPHS